MPNTMVNDLGILMYESSATTLAKASMRNRPQASSPLGSSCQVGSALSLLLFTHAARFSILLLMLRCQGEQL